MAEIKIWRSIRLIFIIESLGCLPFCRCFCVASATPFAVLSLPTYRALAFILMQTIPITGASDITGLEPVSDKFVLCTSPSSLLAMSNAEWASVGLLTESSVDQSAVSGLL